MTVQCSDRPSKVLYITLFFPRFRLEIVPDSPQWVGAWWIGFIISGVLALLVSVPILAFPKQLPGKCTQRSVQVSGWRRRRGHTPCYFWPIFFEKHRQTNEKGMVQYPTLLVLVLSKIRTIPSLKIWSSKGHDIKLC